MLGLLMQLLHLMRQRVLLRRLMLRKREYLLLLLLILVMHWTECDVRRRRCRLAIYLAAVPWQWMMIKLLGKLTLLVRLLLGQRYPTGGMQCRRRQHRSYGMVLVLGKH